jgi:hypothetical protein
MSACLNKQARGLFGEQHIHKLPLYLTPRFDPGIPEHMKISNEAKKLHLEGSAFVHEVALIAYNDSEETKNEMS